MELIETNNYLLKKILSQIHTKIKDFNKNSDRKSFERIRQKVDDYKLTYKYYHDNGLFLKFYQEGRIDKINDAIKIKKMQIISLWVQIIRDLLPLDIYN